MSLFGGLHLGSGAITATQKALQVTGNNIANAATPGFVREEAQLAPILPTRNGTLTIGDGVQVKSVITKIDQFLANRAREANSDSKSAEARSTLLRRVEGIFNELNDTDLSTKLSEFFNSLQDLQNRPADPALRTIVVDRGEVVADTIRSLRGRIDDIRGDVSREVVQSVDRINQGVEAIRVLNRQVVAAEAGANGSQAGSLRTARDQEIAKLAELIDFRVVEQPNGTVNLLTDGDFLLFDGAIHKVATIQTTDRGMENEVLVLEGSATPLTQGGRLGGLQLARDRDLAGVIDGLDALASTLIEEFNQIHSSGQGLTSFTDVTGTYVVQDATAALDSQAAGLPFPPVNGSFELRLLNRATGQTQTRIINVDVDGTAGGDSLNDMVAKINAAFGTTAASVTSDGKLRIAAPSDTDFAFGNDSSGFLAGVGVNTFFTGRDSRDIGIHALLQAEPTLFASGKSSAAGDVSNALELADFPNRIFEGVGGKVFSLHYASVVGGLASTSEQAKVQSDGLKTTQQALEGEHLSITGVSIDEETVKLITLQRGFQAAARYISTINQLLDEVINLGR